MAFPAYRHKKAYVWHILIVNPMTGLSCTNV